jgi:CDP-diacylglycerol--serine O-phosphatidyltransferase
MKLSAIAIVPQALTAVRVVLGTYALMAALDGRPYAAATLVSLGAVTDGLDGLAARRLNAASSFGALFDYFADYLCYVMAPWAIARALLAPGGAWIDAALAIPLLTSAIRYARNGLIVADRSLGNAELPGLGTVYFAFLSVVAVFLDAKRALGEPAFSTAFVLFIIAFSLLMIAPFRCAKLTAFGHVPAIVLTLVAVMPFVATEALAGSMFVIGLLYPFVSRIYARPS